MMKRLCFWLLLVLFLAAFAVSLFYFPYNPERLYRVIPPGAVFVGEHEYLAARWTVLAGHPVTRAALRAVGVREAELAALAASPQVRRLLGRMAPRHTLVAYVPRLGRGGRPGWVFASWVGSAAQLRKMELTFGVLPGFTALHLDGGRKSWLLESELPVDGGSRLCMAVVEGMLIGCVSPEPGAVQELVDRVDARAPVIPELAARLEDRAAPGAALDRGWLRRRGGREGGGVLPGMRWELRALGATGMEGRLWTRAAAHWRGRAGPAEPGDPERAQDRREIEALLGDAPAALAVAPYAWLGPQGWGNDTSVVREVTAAVLATNVEENALAFVCLCGTNYGGRILGFRVPTLLAGVKLEEPGRAAAAVSAGLDRLNARYRFGLIASRLAETNRPLIVADGVIPSPYKRLSPEERPAFAVWGRWLVLSSNVEALTTLLERNRPEAAAGVDRLGGAHTGAGEAAVWMDLEATDDALAKLAAVCRLAAYAGEGTGGLGAAGRRLGIARGWVRALSSMRRLQAEMRLDGRELEVSFRLGEDAGGAPAVRESVAP